MACLRPGHCGWTPLPLLLLHVHRIDVDGYGKLGISMDIHVKYGWEISYPRQACAPVAAKPLVLELLCLEVGTSVASALTAETVFESIKCMSDDVNMPARVRMGSKSQILRIFNSGYAHDRNISIFRRRASRVTGNTLIKPNYASVRQLRDSLHRDRHTMTKKVAAAPCSETA